VVWECRASDCGRGLGGTEEGWGEAGEIRLYGGGMRVVWGGSTSGVFRWNPRRLDYAGWRVWEIVGKGWGWLSTKISRNCTMSVRIN